MWSIGWRKRHTPEKAEVLVGCLGSSPSPHYSQAVWEISFHIDNKQAAQGGKHCGHCVSIYLVPSGQYIPASNVTEEMKTHYL